MKRALPIIAAFALVVVTGLVQGLSTGRWRTSHRLEEAITRLERVPLTLGTWQGKDGQLDEQEKVVGSIDGAIVRRYRNQANGKEVTIMLICGRSGPISVHPPEVCYAGSGFTFETEPTHYAAQVPGGHDSADFKTARLSKSHRGVPMRMDLFWTWSADGHWNAPSNPRVYFAGQDALYKLYITHIHGPTEAESDQSAVREFLPLLLPQLDQTLFSN